MNENTTNTGSVTVIPMDFGRTSYTQATSANSGTTYQVSFIGPTTSEPVHFAPESTKLSAGRAWQVHTKDHIRKKERLYREMHKYSDAQERNFPRYNKAELYLVDTLRSALRAPSYFDQSEIKIDKDDEIRNQPLDVQLSHFKAQLMKAAEQDIQDKIATQTAALEKGILEDKEKQEAEKKAEQKRKWSTFFATKTAKAEAEAKADDFEPSGRDQQKAAHIANLQQILKELPAASESVASTAKKITDIIAKGQSLEEQVDAVEKEFAAAPTITSSYIHANGEKTEVPISQSTLKRAFDLARSGWNVTVTNDPVNFQGVIAKTPMLAGPTQAEILRARQQQRPAARAV